MASTTRLVLLAWLTLAGCWPSFAATDAERTVKPVRLAAAGQSTVIKGTLKGSRYIDYQLRASAGQQLEVSLDPSNRSNYFNLLPPESRDDAMFIEGAGDRRFNGLLPDDGVYTVRVYLIRAAARRNETSQYTLSIQLKGTALRPLPAKADALIAGTRYHANGKTGCSLPYVTEARECEAWVVRRGNYGTATVELRWKTATQEISKRRFLFVNGKPEAADTAQPFTFTRNERGYIIVFDGESRFEIPEALVLGG
jgi:hypothetical protein